MDRKTFVVRALAVGAVALGVASASRGAMISAHFIGGGGGTGTGGGVAVDSAGPAGVVAQTGNWNNLDTSSRTSFTFPAVVDDTGATAKLGGNNTTIGFTSGFTFNSSAGTTFGTAEDKQLYTGGIGSTGANVTVTLANVPYAAYDVYIYSRLFAAGTIADSASGASASGNSFASSAYAAYPAGTGNTASGNYALFHETASGTTITLSTGGASSEQVFGVQIVQTPEPASLSALGLGSIGLLARRRRRRQCA